MYLIFLMAKKCELCYKLIGNVGLLRKASDDSLVLIGNDKILVEFKGDY